MSYWFEMYGTRSEDFIEGVKAGIEAYAVWRDGKQYVGVTQRLLKEVLEEVERELKGSKSKGE